MTNPADIEQLIDAHVGKRIRLARNTAGLSQEQLGKMLNLTFQQIQKTEKGINRTGAGRLFQMAQILGVDIGWFYEGLPANILGELTKDKTDALENIDEYVLRRGQTTRLIRAFYAIANPALQKSLYSCITAAAKADI